MYVLSPKQELKSDIEIVIASLKNNGYIIRNLKIFWSDYKVMLSAMKHIVKLFIMFQQKQKSM